MSLYQVCKNYKCDPCWQNESECARANFELKEVKNVEFEVFTKISLLKLVHPKMKISSCFTYPQSILGVYDFLLSDESNRNYIKNYPCFSKR